MLLTYLSPALNVLLVVLLILDRIYKIRFNNDYKESKEAQINALKQQLEFAVSSNDDALIEMHRKRNEQMRVILDEKEIELEKNKNVLIALQLSLEDVTKESDIRLSLNQQVIEELNRVEKNKHDLEIEKAALLKKINEEKVVSYRLSYIKPPPDLEGWMRHES